jgi:hypothetical protein
VGELRARNADWIIKEKLRTKNDLGRGIGYEKSTEYGV